MAPIDAAIVLVFVAYCAASGFRTRKSASSGLEEYFLAGRSLSGVAAGLSMAATQFAADTPLLVTGLIATSGVFSLWRLWIYAVAFLLVGFVLGPAWRRAGVLTDAELSEARYGDGLSVALRGVKALYFGTLFNCAVLSMVLVAAARVAEPFLRFHEWLSPAALAPFVWLVERLDLSLGVADAPTPEQSASNLLSLLLVLLLTTLYSTTGGLRAVVRTDLAQIGIALVATLFYAIVVVDEAGGLSALPARLSALYGAGHARSTLAFTPDAARDAGAVVLGTMAIQWFAQMNADGTGYLAQRTMACRSDRDARLAAVVFVGTQVVLRSLLWIAIALSLLVLLPAHAEPGQLAATLRAPAEVAAREATFVTGIVRYLPAGARGLMLVGMLAALASTLDTHLNWGASYWANDLYGRLFATYVLRRTPGRRELVWVARGSVLLILTLSLVVLTQLSSIQRAWQTTLLLGAAMGAPLLLRWLWWRMTAAAELSAIAVSLLLAPLLLYTVQAEGLRMLLMTLASVLTCGVAIALARGRASPSARAFYERVRPPGVWGPLAAEVGEPPHAPWVRFRTGALATVLGSLATFCALVAAGSALFHSPPPPWLPWRLPWVASLGALALVCAWQTARLVRTADALAPRHRGP